MYTASRYTDYLIADDGFKPETGSMHFLLLRAKKKGNNAGNLVDDELKQYIFCCVYAQVSVTLFFLPIFVMSIAYALIIGRLWGSKPPGEKMDAALTNQARAKRKVSQHFIIRPSPSSISPFRFGQSMAPPAGKPFRATSKHRSAQGFIEAVHTEQ